MGILFGAIGLCIALLVLLYCFLVLPRITQRADMELLCVDYAHRGLWDEQSPENSLGAFAKATNRGYGMELDVQLSKDNQVMVFHDGDLLRMCGIKKRVRDLTCAQLKQLSLLGTGETIPTLAEVLSLVKGRVPLLIEMKGKTPQPTLCKLVALQLDEYCGPFCIESFNPQILSWFKNYRPGYARGQLVTTTNKKLKGKERLASFALSHMLLNVLSRPDFLAVDNRIKKRPSVRLLAALTPAPCFVWTIRSKQDYLACRKLIHCAIFEKITPPLKKS